MKAHVKLQTGRLIVEVEGATIKDLFAAIADVQEVFDADQQCGACGAPWPKFQVRERKGFTYYEMKCHSCRAELQYGQHREAGGLWPKRVDDEGKALAHNGWKKWMPEK